MDCNETHRLLDANIDGELDLVRHLELEAHLRTCPACALLAENARARNRALRESLPRFAASPQLAEGIRASLRHAALRPQASPGEAEPPAAKRAKIIFFPWRIVGLAACMGCALLIGYKAGNIRARDDLPVDEAVSSHVRSLQVSHLTDVASTDQHTVKPWFVGKLDFSPPVTDLAADGFPLIGGRLDLVNGRQAAALVFHRRQHTINLFVWPAGPGAVDPRQIVREGYVAQSWSDGGLNFIAVSEIPAAELAHFVELFRAKTH